MLAFGAGACHRCLTPRGNIRQLCQTDTGNDHACPRLDWHYAVDLCNRLTMSQSKPVPPPCPSSHALHGACPGRPEPGSNGRRGARKQVQVDFAQVSNRSH
ncbi:hypothetical protein CNECB9_1890017 [Cupriavidus necator]|uniref:Uncharacterized protein n=1 Tax=Cupriavidus necator TaxID=106590 RepID=A0A1K0IBA9_CUPNE|nr:hypothetical protein CNECB9_1890017 [Cupriavidus necator]